MLHPQKRFHRLINIHVEADDDIPLRRGHKIVRRVKDALLSSEPGVADVLIHIEPHE